VNKAHLVVVARHAHAAHVLPYQLKHSLVCHCDRHHSRHRRLTLTGVPAQQQKRARPVALAALECQ
jgi:hypothetical protein